MKFDTELNAIVEIWIERYRQLINNPEFSLNEIQLEDLRTKITHFKLHEFPYWSLKSSIVYSEKKRAGRVFLKIEEWKIQAKKQLREDAMGELEYYVDELGRVNSFLKPDSPSAKGHKAAGSIHKNTR